MKKVVILLIATLSLSLVACNTKEVQADFFGETLVINSSDNKELINLIDDEISSFDSELKDVETTEFVVKINGEASENYKEYDKEINDIEVDVYEYVFVIKEEVVGFNTAKIEDYSINKGSEVVDVEGVDGLLVSNVMELYINGVFSEIIESIVDDELSYDPIDEVVRVGMKDIDNENPKYTKETCDAEVARRIEEDSAENVTMTYVCIPVDNSSEYQIQILQ